MPPSPSPYIYWYFLRIGNGTWPPERYNESRLLGKQGEPVKNCIQHLLYLYSIVWHFCICIQLYDICCIWIQLYDISVFVSNYDICVFSFFSAFSFWNILTTGSWLSATVHGKDPKDQPDLHLQVFQVKFFWMWCFRLTFGFICTIYHRYTTPDDHLSVSR